MNEHEAELSAFFKERAVKRILLILWLLLLPALTSKAQTIRVNPDGVNVNASDATTVFLTFGQVQNYRPAEATWCGELLPAAPDLGFRCNPATIFGMLPARFNLSRSSGNFGFTDIMSIPPSVARRAYQAAQDGAVSSFFYVRRFVSTSGGPDQFVPVTCRLTGGGARTPFALTDVRVSFADDTPIVFLKPGEPVPAAKAEIRYNGTGRLRGRWEVVLPGEELPEPEDLLTEASLPFEQRAQQRRYTPVGRFNVFLPPTGRYVLPGPDPAQLMTMVEGSYLLLLRIEASDDKEADSSLAITGTGPGIVHSGAVAGFPLPVLRYLVGNGTASAAAAMTAGMTLLLPRQNAVANPGQPLDFVWADNPGAALYRLEVETAESRPVLQAILPAGTRNYRAPPWLREKAGSETVRWRVVAIDPQGTALPESSWRSLRLPDP